MTNQNVIVDYSTFPLEVLKRALSELRNLQVEGFPIDGTLVENLRLHVTDRVIEEIRVLPNWTKRCPK